MTRDPQLLARRCADAMWADDRASQGLGMKLASVAAGQAEMTMAVEPDHDQRPRHVSRRLYLHARRLGVRLRLQLATTSEPSPSTARSATSARQSSAIGCARSPSSGPASGRSGIYDVTVTTEDGTVIAEFRGHSRTIEGTLV